MKTRRKNKLTYANLEAELDNLIEQWNFDPNNGTAQLLGSKQDRVLAYGQVMLLRRILDCWRA